MSQADPQLLSLLQKIANPITNLDIQIKVKGVFSPPQQWKTTDEQNPNIFTYSIQLMNRKFTSGKIQPKKSLQPTLQADDKNKKAGKKQVIKEEEKPIEQDEETKRKRLEWESLPEQQRFYRTSQDQDKMYSLKWAQNQANQTLTQQQIQEIQNIVSTGKADIILIRRPDMTEDDIAKLKKSKPKTLNLAELYEAKYKGIINLQNLQVPGCTSTSQRVKLSLFGEIPGDGVKIQTQTAYAYIQVSFSNALSPQVIQIKPQLSQVLPNISNLSPSSTNIIQQLKTQITRGIKAINQEYINFFSKEKDYPEDRKNQSTLSTLRLNEINKRKDMFLNEFLANGKFALLRERIALSIKAIIVDKVRKQRSSGTITKLSIHKTLSQLNVFFQQFISQTIDYVLTSQSVLIHQDILLNHQQSKGSRAQSIAPIQSESMEEREVRIAEEYQTVNDVGMAEEKYLNLVLLNGKSIEALYKHQLFLAKIGKLDQAYQLCKIINLKENRFKFRFALALFMVQRRRTNQVLKMLTQLIESESSAINEKILCNNLLSFMYEMQGDVLRSQKYLAQAQKYFQIKKNPHLKLNQSSNPYLQPRPLIPEPQHYSSQLSSIQSQQMLITFIQMIQSHHLYQLISLLLKKLLPSQTKQILTIKVKLFQKKHQECLEILDHLIEKQTNNVALLEMKAEICFNYHKIFQAEEVFLHILKLKPNQHHAYKAYLRLGYTYTHRKAWDDAKHTFQKVCQLRNNSSLGWLGLGISLLELKMVKQAEQAFTMSSIYDPLSKQPRKYLNKINLIRKIQNEQKYKYVSSN